MRCWIFAAIFTVSTLLGCDTQVPQTVVVRANFAGANPESFWLVESDRCDEEPINARWYRRELWIFGLSSTRGGLGVVTQELALCYKGSGTSPIVAWHGLHGGGAPLIVLSCDEGEGKPCALYMDQYTEGTWEGPRKR